MSVILGRCNVLALVSSPRDDVNDLAISCTLSVAFNLKMTLPFVDDVTLWMVAGILLCDRCLHTLASMLSGDSLLGLITRVVFCVLFFRTAEA